MASLRTTPVLTAIGASAAALAVGFGVGRALAPDTGTPPVPVAAAVPATAEELVAVEGLFDDGDLDGIGADDLPGGLSDPRLLSDTANGWAPPAPVRLPDADTAARPTSPGAAAVVTSRASEPDGGSGPIVLGDVLDDDGTPLTVDLGDGTEVDVEPVEVEPEELGDDIAQHSSSGAPSVDDAPQFVDLCAEWEDPGEISCPDGQGGTVLLAIDGDPAPAPVGVLVLGRPGPECTRDHPDPMPPATRGIQVMLSRPAELSVMWHPVDAPHDVRVQAAETGDDALDHYREREADPGFDPQAWDNTWACLLVELDHPGTWQLTADAEADDGGTGRDRFPLDGLGLEHLVELRPLDDHSAALHVLTPDGASGAEAVVGVLPRGGPVATDATCTDWEAAHLGGDRSLDDPDRVLRRQGTHPRHPAVSTFVFDVDDPSGRHPLGTPGRPRIHAYVHPRQGVTYEICVLRTVRTGTETRTDRGSVLFSSPVLARPRMQIVAAEGITDQATVSVVTRNWEIDQTMGAVLPDAPRAVRDELGSEQGRTMEPARGRVPDLTLLMVRNLSTNQHFFASVPTPSTSCADDPLGRLGRFGYSCRPVSPTRFVWLDVPGARRATGLCGASFGGSCDPPSTVDRIARILVQVDMIDPVGSERHGQGWSVSPNRIFGDIGLDGPDADVPQLARVRWRVRFDDESRGSADPAFQPLGGETTEVTWLFDRPVSGLSYALGTGEGCPSREPGTATADPTDARIVRATFSGLCHGASLVVRATQVVDVDGVSHDLNLPNRLVAWMSMPYLEAELVMRWVIDDPEDRILVPRSTPALRFDRRAHRLGGAPYTCAPGTPDGWDSGARSTQLAVGRAFDPAAEQQLQVVIPEVIAPCERPALGLTDQDVAFETTTSWNALLAATPEDPMVLIGDLPGGLTVRTEVSASLPLRDPAVWDDRNLPGTGDDQYER